MLKLEYKTYLMGKTDHSSDLVLIVLLHFMGSNPDQTFDIIFSQFNHSARVIVPFGQYRYEDQYLWFPEQLYEESEERQGHHVDELVRLLLENVKVWTQEHGIKKKLIFLGVSQGGDMCFTLAAKHGDQFRLCMPIAGRLLTEETDKKKEMGIINIHPGVQDPIVPIESVRQATKHLNDEGIEARLHAYEDTGHMVPDEMIKAIHQDIYAVIESI